MTIRRTCYTSSFSFFFFYRSRAHRDLHSFPTRRSSDLQDMLRQVFQTRNALTFPVSGTGSAGMETCVVNLIEPGDKRSEEHTSELQSQFHLVCRLLLEKKKKKQYKRAKSSQIQLEYTIA